MRDEIREPFDAAQRALVDDYALAFQNADVVALTAYQRAADGVYRAHAVQVLACTAAGISHIVAFRDPELFALFGLPPEIRENQNLLSTDFA